MPRSFPKLLSSPSLPPLCSQAAAGLLSITVLLEFYINGVIQPMHFSVWLLSLSNVISRVTHVIAHIAISFFLIQSMAVPHTRVVRLSIALWMDIWAGMPVGAQKDKQKPGLAWTASPERPDDGTSPALVPTQPGALGPTGSGD